MTREDDRDDAIEAKLGAFFEAPGLDPDPPSSPHLEDGTLARLAEGLVRPTAAQRAHLLECLECRDVLGTAAVHVPATAPEPRRFFTWRFAVLPGLMAAAAAAFVMFAPAGDRGDGYRRRGGEDRYAEASVAVLASSSKGRGVIESGAKVPLDAQLGFRYGNPASEAKTLTVLGYDGSRVHWYYPKSPTGAAFELARGPEAVSKRLPFDIRLQERHRAGPLHVYAAFDVEPAVLAAAIAKGTPPKGAIHLSLELVSP